MIFEQNTIRRLYKKLISLYPSEFRERFGDSMEQTFNDVWAERKQRQKLSFGFLLWMFAETSVGIIKEIFAKLKQGGFMEKIASNSKRAALVGFLLILPFIILNTIAANQIEPLFTIFKVNIAGNFWDYPIGYFSFLTALFLLPVGAFIAIRPVLQMNSNGRSLFKLVNVSLAILLSGIFVLVAFAFLTEFYRCNVLFIPNCD